MIFRYDNGHAVMLHESEVSNPGNDVSPEIKFIYRNGRTYLRHVSSMVNGNYFTIIDGEWVVVLNYIFDVWGSFGTDDEGAHFVNGVPVTIEELFLTIEMMETGEVTIITLVPCCFGPNELYETERVVSSLRVR
ncbi:MAG: hypothetical protein FWC71_11395 [Defluviitaleaceae bacterium]|nr:hypothetical protein [Defluviitaleaceae bacterium]